MTKNFIKIIILLCVYSFSFLAYSSHKSTDSLSKKNRVLLTVTVEEIGYYPYHYDDNGERKGFSIDILDYIEANSKYDFEFIILPWPRALHLVSEGKVDIILTLFKNPEREKTYNYIEPSYGNEANQLFTLVDKNIDYNGRLQHLAPYTIGTKREYSYGETFDQANYLTKLPALTEKVLLKLLLGGRIDVAIANPFIFNKIMLQNKVRAKVKAIEPYVEITPVFMGLTKNRKDSEEIKVTIGQLIRKLKSTEYYQSLLDKYQLDFNKLK